MKLKSIWSVILNCTKISPPSLGLAFPVCDIPDPTLPLTMKVLLISGSGFKINNRPLVKNLVVVLQIILQKFKPSNLVLFLRESARVCVYE